MLYYLVFPDHNGVRGEYSMEALEGHFDLRLMTCDLWLATCDLWVRTCVFGVILIQV